MAGRQEDGCLHHSRQATAPWSWSRMAGLSWAGLPWHGPNAAYCWILLDREHLHWHLGACCLGSTSCIDLACGRVGSSCCLPSAPECSSPACAMRHVIFCFPRDFDAVPVRSRSYGMLILSRKFQLHANERGFHTFSRDFGFSMYCASHPFP